MEIKNYIIKNKLNIIVILAIILIIIIGIKMKYITVYDNSKIVNSEIKLRNALNDSIKYYKDKSDNLIASKLSLQYDIDKLTNNVKGLNNNKKMLINEINELKNKNNIISAALIDANVLIDSLKLKGNVDIDTNKNIITFYDNYKNNNYEMNYKFTVINVRSIINKKPELIIDSLRFPNKQFITFTWDDDKKSNYPISFSIKNSNEFYKINDIDSYVIPGINKETINPTTFDKIKNYLDRNSNNFIYIGIGGLIGAGAVLIIN